MANSPLCGEFSHLYVPRAKNPPVPAGRRRSDCAIHFLSLGLRILLLFVAFLEFAFGFLAYKCFSVACGVILLFVDRAMNGASPLFLLSYLLAQCMLLQRLTLSSGMTDTALRSSVPWELRAPLLLQTCVVVGGLLPSDFCFVLCEWWLQFCTLSSGMTDTALRSSVPREMNGLAVSAKRFGWWTLVGGFGGRRILLYFFMFFVWHLLVSLFCLFFHCLFILFGDMVVILRVGKGWLADVKRVI